MAGSTGTAATYLGTVVGSSVPPGTGSRRTRPAFAAFVAARLGDWSADRIRAAEPAASTPPPTAAVRSTERLLTACDRGWLASGGVIG